MFRNIIFVLMYHRHKLFDLIKVIYYTTEVMDRLLDAESFAGLVSFVEIITYPSVSFQPSSSRKKTKCSRSLHGDVKQYNSVFHNQLPYPTGI
jgi:hypothetical protein